MRLQGKYIAVSLILKALWNFPKEGDIKQFSDLIEQIERWNYRVDKSKDVFTQLEKISARLQGILTQIELLEDSLQKEDVKESKSIESQLLSVSRILELRYSLNAKEIMVSEWVELCKQADEVIKERQKQQQKKK